MTLDTGTIIEHRRVLDLRHGVLTRTWRQCLHLGTRMTFHSACFASMAEPQLLVLWADIDPDGSEAHVGAGAEGPVLTEIPTRAGRVEFATLTSGFAGRMLPIAAVHRPGGSQEVPVREVLGRAADQRLGGLLAHHEAAWGQQRWRAADVVVEMPSVRKTRGRGVAELHGNVARPALSPASGACAGPADQP